MTIEQFEGILDDCCRQLTKEALRSRFRDSFQFENRVRQTLAKLTVENPEFTVDFNPNPQAFPDIAMGEFGVEVKFTQSDTWRSIANSVLEKQRIEEIKYIYVVFGKMGGTPSVRWSEYEKSVIHVRTSHVPRFEIEIPTNGEERESLFKKFGISYDEFRRLEMKDKIRYIREYAKKLHPDGELWWIVDDDKEHTTPVQARLYSNLSSEEKLHLRAEAALLFPEIVKSGRTRNKYDAIVLHLLTYHGVLCHQARDMFSAGSVANPKNDDAGGIYIERALKLLEGEMGYVAETISDELIKKYWGESVPQNERIKRWLEKADALAVNWKPSKSLFR